MTDTFEFPNDSFDSDHEPQSSSWLASHELADIRRKMPIVYIDAIPVKVDESGDIISVGLLLRVTESGTVSRAVVSGRVMYHERIRDAILRHIEKDLGPVALPQIPVSPQPFTVAEYLPTPGVTAFHDPRQHAISLAYVVPISGDCQPQQSALDLTWLTPEEACSDVIVAEMVGGQGQLIRHAMAYAGRI